MSVLKAEGLKASKKAVWATIKKYKIHGTIFHLPGSGRPCKLTENMLQIIEDHMKRMLEDKGYKVSKPTIIRARKILGWTIGVGLSSR